MTGLTPTRPTALVLAEMEAEQRSETRYLDLCLILRQKSTGRKLLEAGGRWDRIAQRYDGSPTRCKIVDLQESQIEFTEWFAEWLDAFKNGRPRDKRLVMASGERRGGKTFNLVQACIAMAIAVPKCIVWMVSPSYQERDELERTIREYIPTVRGLDVNPRAWARYRGIPDYRFTFQNGSVVQSISSDDPETLKRGRADLVFLNEAQKHPIAALTNAIPGTIDRAGLVLLAANPPRSKRGVWVKDLRDAIDEETITAAKYFTFKAGGNDAIDLGAKADVGQILGILDPKAKAADDEGLWLPVGERAYFAFRRKADPATGNPGNLGKVPDLGDVMGAVLKRKGVGRDFHVVAGADFQASPFNCAAFVRPFGDPLRPTYYVVGEVFTEGHEDDFIDDMIDAGYDAESTIVIGDSSGTFQDNERKHRGRYSFDYFKARRYRIEAPRKGKADPNRPRNPDKRDRVSLVNKLLAQGRLVIDRDRAPRIAEALAECEAKDWLPKPNTKYTHPTDALGYALFWLEPEPRKRVTLDASRILDRTATRPTPF